MELNAKISGLDGLVARLNAFPKEMAKGGGPIRSALFQGAKLVREQAKTNVRQIVSENVDNESKGVLENAVIMKRHRDPRSRGATEIYSVRLKRAKNAKGIPVTRYGKILEFGSEFIRPHAWLRSAAAQQASAAMAAIALHLRKGIERIEKKMGVLRK